MICSCCTEDPPADPMSATGHLYALCKRRGLAVMRVLCHDRSRTAVKMRRELAVELRTAGYSLPEIGRAMRRDHSTIHHALKRAGRPGEST